MAVSGEIENPGDAAAARPLLSSRDPQGPLKIMSKMGISTISSYRGAQLFEIVGLHDEVVSAASRIRSAGSRAPRFRPGGRPAGAGEHRLGPRKPRSSRAACSLRPRRRVPCLQPGRGQCCSRPVHVRRLRRLSTLRRALVNERPATLRDLLKLRPNRRGPPHRSGRAGNRGDPAALRLRRHVARAPCRRKPTRLWPLP
jgi:glutamate synthase (NADPH/NADH) large chain